MDLLLALPIMLRHTFNVMRNQNVYYDRYVSQRWLAIDTYMQHCNMLHVIVIVM